VGLGDRQIRGNCTSSSGILVKFDRGKLATIEITLNPRRFENIRIDYYAARLYTTQEIRGAERGFKDLADTYQISIVGGNGFLTMRSRSTGLSITTGSGMSF
jgi:hypothetical protein